MVTEGKTQQDNQVAERSLKKDKDPTPVARQPEVVVVTGASAGLGRAIVRAFARQGAHIGLLARGRDGLEGARRDVEALGGQALALPTDVADADGVERAAEAVEREFGPIDIWINNAMVAAVLLGQITSSEQAAARAADLPAGSRRGSRPLCRPQRPARDACRLPDSRGDNR